MMGVSLHLKGTTVACSKEIEPRVTLPKKSSNSSVLILGGTGRVGGSTAIALSKLCPDLRIVVGGRNREKGAALVSTIGENSEFAEVNIDNVKSLDAALNDVDLVVHTAGPFQQTKKCSVLEAAIAAKTAYVDVSDATSYAWRAKSFHSKAVAENVPAITAGGVFPGVSNVMAAELVRAARKSKRDPVRLRFYYYTEGSGGAGPTILASNFLLLGEEVVVYDKGEKTKLKPFSGMLPIDFGKGIGKRDVYLLNFPEVRSAHEFLGVPTVSARFGTAPVFWNWGMAGLASLFPAEFLRDRYIVQQLVQLFDPFVRAIDVISGERVSIRVDLECSNGRNTVGVLSHRSLSASVGTSIAAFALAILEGNTKPGVWFPEEPEGIAIEARETLLKRAAQGTINFIMNKSAAALESDESFLRVFGFDNCS